MEMKWIALVSVVFIVFVGITKIVDSYLNNQCRIESVTAGKSSAEIAEICK
jgi:hypothetical protein